MPVYTLTLEDRATCPARCAQWTECYGNNMHLARRNRHGAALEARIPVEIAALAMKHPAGFVIRIHVLGDFYSEAYAQTWYQALALHPQLRLFGYTAHDPETPLGEAILELNLDFPDRCRIRFSGHDAGAFGAIVVESEEKAEPHHVVCPAQTERTDCCSTCGYCWIGDKTVAFLRH
jgi:hypothetical protein